MSKNPHPNTGKKKAKRDWKDTKPFYYFDSIPISDDFLDRLAEEYVEWAWRSGQGELEEQSFVISDFLDEKNIPTSTFYAWLDRHPRLKMAHNLVKRRIGSRRERSSFLKKTSESLFLFSAALYSESWQERHDYKLLAEWKKKLDEKERDQQAQNFVVQMPSFGDMNAISNDDNKAEQVQAPAVPDPRTECPGE